MAHVNENGILIYNEITKAEVVQANYLASKKDDSKVDDAIEFYTGLMPWNWGAIDASHTEIGFWVDGELWFCSSTSRNELGAGKENGTRWIKGSELLRHPDRWHLQVKTVSVNAYPIRSGDWTWQENIPEKIRRANWLIGLRYDFCGVFTDFTIPYRVFRKVRLGDVLVNGKLKEIYCSKVVHAIDTGWLQVYSPKRRYKWAKRHGYKSVESTIDYMYENGYLSTFGEGYKFIKWDKANNE